MLFNTAPYYDQKHFYFMIDIILVVCVGVDTVEESMKPNFLVTRVGKKSVPQCATKFKYEF